MVPQRDVDGTKCRDCADIVFIKIQQKFRKINGTKRKIIEWVRLSELELRIFRYKAIGILITLTPAVSW